MRSCFSSSSSAKAILAVSSRSSAISSRSKKPVSRGVQRENADRLALDQQRKARHRVGPLGEKQLAFAHLGVVGDVVPDLGLAGTQRAPGDAAAGFEVGARRHLDAVERGGVDHALRREPDHILRGGIEQADLRGAEAADVDRDAAHFGGELRALALAHQRGIDAAGELADAGKPDDARAMLDLLGDVARQAVDALGRAARAADQACAVVDPAHLAVRTHDAVVDVELAVLPEALPGLLRERPVWRMDHLGLQLRVRDQLLRREAEDRLRRGAHVQVAARLGVDRPERIGQRSKDARQPLARQVELDLGAAARAALLRLGERALDRRGQAHQVRLENIVGGAALQRADRIFLADGARDEDERRVGTELARHRERSHAVESRHREVGQDDVGRELAQRPLERLLAVHQPMPDTQAGALELAQLELGVGPDVFGEQYPDGRRAHRGHFVVGTRLVSSQYRPMLDTVSRKASNCTGLTM